MPSGGARPGAGRKKQATNELQYARREVVMAALTPERLLTIVEHDIAAAEAGHTERIDRWLPYVLGSPRQEIGVGDLDGGPLKIVVQTVRDRGRDGV